ncbi:uncharacterized protein YALI1_F11916g [Yarrowia lipolytica]|uniref:Uncharacterized protein n=1 Tax=Yarrowia lipolytica TaxID=4952 RepID=A0A1D8NMJ3_YARLL|nr:hypothetical protein YALI1_F11916g [Yarrowia lipolytica]
MRYWSFIIVYQCNPDLWIMELPSTVGTNSAYRLGQHLWSWSRECIMKSISVLLVREFATAKHTVGELEGCSLSEWRCFERWRSIDMLSCGSEVFWSTLS